MHKNLLLLAVSLALSFALAELVLRIAAPDLGLPDGRLLFTTEAPYRDEFGAIRYPPHRSLRSALLYGDEIEIDTRYGTNDLGLFDHRDYLPPAATGPRYALVGDSYAAGVESGRPWIPALRDRLGIEAYALGMSATGVLGFERMLQSEARRLPFTEVVFVAISDDFYRALWRPLVHGDEIRLCGDAESDDACKERSPIAYVMRYDMTAASLVAQAREIHARIARNRSAARNVLRESRILMLARHLVLKQVWQAGRRHVLDDSLAALARIRAAYPAARLRFVHVPDRHETQRGAYDLDVRALLAGTGIEYLPVLGTCPWSMRHYFPRDNHPNEAGYEALGRCVAGMLGLERPAWPR